MGIAFGPEFGAQNKGKSYGFKNDDTICVFVVETDAVTPGAASFTIRTTGTCTYIVYWGDETSETVTATSATHTYAEPGTYNVGIEVVSGTFRPYYNNNADGDIITKFRGRSGYGFTGSLDNAFYGCGNLDEITADFSEVTSITGAFRDSTLVNFQNTGVGVTVLKRNLFGFNDLGGITGFSNTFYNCPSLKTLAGIGFTNVTSFSNIFGGTTVLNKFGTEDLPIQLGTDTSAGNVSFQSLFLNNSSLTDFHVDSAIRVNNFYQTFQNSSLPMFGREDNRVGLGTTGSNSTLCNCQDIFYTSSSLKEFHIDSGNRIDSMYRAFQQSGIGTFTIGDNDLGNVSTFQQAFYSSSLKSFGTEANPISFGSRNGADMTAIQAFYSASSLTDFFITDSARINSLQQAFQGSGIVNFGTETTPVGIGSTADNTSTIDFYRAFYQVSSLKEAHIESGNRIGRFLEAFYSSGIGTITFGDNDLRNCTSMASAFQASSIKSFGTEANPIAFGSRNGADLSLQSAFQSTSALTDVFITDSARITSLYSAFQSSGIVNFGSETTPVGLGSTADNTSTVDLYNSFYGASSQKEFHIDSGNRIWRLQSAFQNSGITTFRIVDNDLTNLTAPISMFQNAYYLEEFGTEANPIIFGNRIGADMNFTNAFYNTSALNDVFIGDCARITNMTNAFYQSGINNFGSETTPVGLGSTADNPTLCSWNQAFYNSSSSPKQVHINSGNRISTLQSAFQSSGIGTFRIGDNNLKNCTSMYTAFHSASSFTNFGTEANPISFGTTADNSSTINLTQAFYSSGVDEFHIDSGNRISTLSQAFQSSGIGTFRVGDGDLSNVSSMSGAFYNLGGANNFTEFGTEANPITFGSRIGADLSLSASFQNATNMTDFFVTDSNRISSFYDAFRGTSMVNFGSETTPVGLGSTADNPTTVDCYAAFYQVTPFKEFHVDSGNRIWRLQSTFGYSGITTFSIGDNDLSNVTTLYQGFYASTGAFKFGTEANPITFGNSDAANVNLSQAFQSSQVTDFFAINSARLTTFNNAFQNSGIVNFGSETTPVGLGSTADNPTTCSLYYGFQNATSLKEAHIDSGNRIASMHRAYYGCGGLTTFRLGDNDLSNCTDMTYSFNQAGILEFGTEANPITFGSRTGADVSFTYGFNGASALTDFFITDSARVNSFSYTFTGSGMVNFGSSTTPIGIGSTADNSTTCTINNTFQNVTSLKEVHIESGQRISSFNYAFSGASGLTTFRINDTNLFNCSNLAQAFTNAALDADSIENILVSCDNGGKSSISLTMSGGTNAAKSTWSGIATVAYDNLVAKSWSITYNA